MERIGVESKLVERRSGTDAHQRLLSAALEAFAERGFEATTTRQICMRAGMSPAGLYVYFDSKQEVLHELCVRGHRGVDAALDSALIGSAGPIDRLRSAVHALVVWHSENATLARVVQYELRSLEPESFAAFAERRHAFERRLGEEVSAVSAAAGVEVDNHRAMVRAILSLIIDIARWYSDRERSRLPPHILADAYADLVLGMLRVR